MLVMVLVLVLMLVLMLVLVKWFQLQHIYQRIYQTKSWQLCTSWWISIAMRMRTRLSLKIRWRRPFPEIRWGTH